MASGSSRPIAATARLDVRTRLSCALLAGPSLLLRIQLFRVAVGTIVSSVVHFRGWASSLHCRMHAVHFWQRDLSFRAPRALTKFLIRFLPEAREAFDCFPGHRPSTTRPYSTLSGDKSTSGAVRKVPLWKTSRTMYAFLWHRELAYV